MNHYFNNKYVKDSEFSFSECICSVNFKFYSNNGVFSKKHVDSYSNILIKSIYENEKPTNILDVGCGYGVIGIVLARLMDINVEMIDINVRAVELAKKNCELNNVNCYVYESDLFNNVNGKFDLIVSNPPIRAGKKTCYELYNKSKLYLSENGSLYIVISKQHGAKSTIKFLETIYTKVEIIYKKNGIYVLKSTV